MADFLDKYSGRKPAASREAGSRCSTSGRSARTRSPARDALARRGDRPGAARRGARARRAPPRAAAGARGPARAQEPGEQADRRAAADRRGRLGGDRRGARRCPSARRSSRRSCARWRSGAATVLPALPNLPDPTAPDEDEVIREVGEAGRTGRSHVELLGDDLDMERAARVSGSRFVYLKGPLVRLELALVQWALSLLEERGLHARWSRPCWCASSALFGTGHAARHRAAALPACRRTSSTWSGTSEVPLASLHAGEILAAGELPLRYAGFSPCFRREAGAAGKDTQGMFRVHQFDKVEMFTFVEPERVAGRARAAARDRGGDPAGARDPVPGGEHRGERPRRVRREEVRPRGVAAGPGPLPRAHLVLEHDRLPGAPARRPLPPGGGRGRPPRAHAERDGRGGGPDDHRDRGEPPAATTEASTSRRCCTRSGRRARSSSPPEVGGAWASNPRRGGRAVECAGLESR